MFLQTSVSIFFKPELSSNDLITRLIRSDNPTEKVSSILKKLGQGEFLVYGMLEAQDGMILSDSLIYASANKPFNKETDTFQVPAKTASNKQITNAVDVSFITYE